MSFSGRRGVEQGQDITYVTERCVMKLTPEGSSSRRSRPASTWSATSSAQSDIPLGVAKDLKTTPATLFQDAPIGLDLGGGNG